MNRYLTPPHLLSLERARPRLLEAAAQVAAAEAAGAGGGGGGGGGGRGGGAAVAPGLLEPALALIFAALACPAATERGAKALRTLCVGAEAQLQASSWGMKGGYMRVSVCVRKGGGLVA